MSGLYHGQLDVFVRKYSATGMPLWRRHNGTSDDDGESVILAPTGSGGYLITGTHRGHLAIEVNRGESDVFLMRLSRDGETE